jgi:hypothetical protein
VDWFSVTRLTRIGGIAAPHNGHRPSTPAPIFWVDAGSTASYPGTGTTWTDISPVGRSGTIYGATWDSGGWFDLSGSFNWAEWGFTYPTYPAGTDPISMSVVFQTYSASGDQAFLSMGDITGARVSLWLHGPTGMIGVESAGGARATSAWAGISTWVHLTAVSTGPNKFDFDLYVNGSLVTSSDIGGNGARNVATAYTGAKVGMYANAVTGFVWGKVALGKIWARTLTAAQVAADFETTRTRFGL